MSKQVVIGLTKTQTPANSWSILIIHYVEYQNLSLNDHKNLQFICSLKNKQSVF